MATAAEDAPNLQWSPFAATYDGAVARLYLNGALGNQAPWTQGICPGNSPLAWNAGNYAVRATDSAGIFLSSNAYLTTNPAGVSLALSPGLTLTGIVGLTYGIQYNTNAANTNGWHGAANEVLDFGFGACARVRLNPLDAGAVGWLHYGP